MVILDKMIQARRLTEFIREFVKIRNQELEDQTRWEFWLHRVFDMTFKEFLSKTEQAEETEEVLPDEVLQATVLESMGIITGFCPS
jgi:hypothetical protein